MLLALELVFGGASFAQSRISQPPQALWITSYYFDSGGFISEILPEQYQHSGIPKRALNTGLSRIGLPGKIAFDAAGDLWIPFCPNSGPPGPGIVAALSPSALKSIAANRFKDVTVAATLSSPSAPCPGELTFDASGNLWVGNGSVINNGAQPLLLEYASSDLFKSGAQPVTVLTSTALHRLGPATFDKQGNLWVTDPTSSTFEFTPNQLSSGGSQSPELTLQSTAQNPREVAFDSGGNLWIAYGNGGTTSASGSPLPLIVKILASDLVGSGTITPTPAVTFVGPKFCSPIDLCTVTGEVFDAAGNLWVKTGQMVLEYSPEQQITGGSPLAALTLAPNFDDTPTGDINRLNFFDDGTLVFAPEVK